mgnify:CR=1 FL=1
MESVTDNWNTLYDMNKDNSILNDVITTDCYSGCINAKYINSCIRRLKSYFKAMGIEKSDDDIYKLAYSSLPKVASSDSSIRKMYSNGHFCYGRKFGIITNGCGTDEWNKLSLQVLLNFLLS